MATWETKRGVLALLGNSQNGQLVAAYQRKSERTTLWKSGESGVQPIARWRLGMVAEHQGASEDWKEQLLRDSRAVPPQSSWNELELSLPQAASYLPWNALLRRRTSQAKCSSGCGASVMRGKSDGVTFRFHWCNLWIEGERGLTTMLILLYILFTKFPEYSEESVGQKAFYLEKKGAGKDPLHQLLLWTLQLNPTLYVVEVTRLERNL